MMTKKEYAALKRKKLPPRFQELVEKFWYERSMVRRYGIENYQGTMTRNEFIHQAMLQMAGNGKIFSGNMHSRQKEIDEIRDAAVALADAAQETAPFDE